MHKKKEEAFETMDGWNKKKQRKENHGGTKFPWDERFLLYCSKSSTKSNKIKYSEHVLITSYIYRKSNSIKMTASVY